MFVDGTNVRRGMVTEPLCLIFAVEPEGVVDVMMELWEAWMASRRLEMFEDLINSSPDVMHCKNI
jgi:hypothetical protein